jgi:hypothetical protein
MGRSTDRLLHGNLDTCHVADKRLDDLSIAVSDLKFDGQTDQLEPAAILNAPIEVELFCRL